MTEKVTETNITQIPFRLTNIYIFPTHDIKTKFCILLNIYVIYC